MKMTYYDHCPDEYEPPYFVALDPDRVSKFSREPCVMYLTCYLKLESNNFNVVVFVVLLEL